LSSIHVLTPATLSDRVFDELEQEIVSGQIAMGTKLGEEVLAARFGVSRGPLREALRRLEGRALVERTAHAGVRVVNLDTRDLIELYGLRESLEGLAARLATENMSEPELDSLDELLRTQEQPSDTVYSHVMGEEDFHFRVAAGSGSARLQKLLCGDLYSLIRLCRFRTWTMPGQLKSYRDHARIVEAMRDRDADLAEMLMRRHVAKARERFLAAESPPSAGSILSTG
jgi:DNA-binding GntR family transcriptional regulator